MAIIQPTKTGEALRFYVLLTKHIAQMHRKLHWPQKQAGFRRGGTCIDQVSIIPIVIDEMIDKKFRSISHFYRLFDGI